MTGNSGGALEKRGTDTFTFAGTGSYGGFTEIENGEFILTGSINGTSNLNVIDGPLTGGGTLTIDGGSLTTAGLTTLDTGGTLTLINGGALNSNGGFDNSAEGTLNFEDGTFTVTGGAFVPNEGTTTDDYRIDGPTASETPHLMLGVGASASIGRDLYVGDLQRGELTVSGGAIVSSRVGNIGENAGSNGTVTVDGDDGAGTPSTWNTSLSLNVGESGTGTLNITGGGSVTNLSSVNIARLSGSTGAATVDGHNGAGTRSTWDTPFFVVGTAGNGTLDITGGGLLTSSNSGVIGSSSTSTGVATVDGTDGAGTPSSWTMTSELSIGASGDGTLNITGGGLATLMAGSDSFLDPLAP